MKHIFAFLLLLFPFVSFANDIASMSANDVIAIFDETLPFIEERMKKINPDLVNKMTNADNMDKIYEYQNFMVHYVFDEKVAQYVDMLYKHCEQTGCRILHIPDNAWETWNIDQPDKETPECYKNGDVGNERICPWPKDYDWSTMTLTNGEFIGFIDDLDQIHVYRMVTADTQGQVMLSLYETSWSHQEQIEYNNTTIYCNSEDRPYVRAYKECVAKDPEPNLYFKTCKDESLKNWAIAEHDKCLGEHHLPATIVSGGFFRTLKTW
ncbi:MAG: hypothetical protein IKN73_01190 [Alphaproteobacteria bacterium]|nr:hypothetical protein [Alphaproteobacteria bacterium]